MLSENETTLNNIIHLFNHHQFNPTAQALRLVEKSMSTLDISEESDSRSSSPTEFEEPTEFGKPTEIMASKGGGIGARIMRRLRPNSRSEAPQAKPEKKKTLNSNSKAIEKLYLNKTLGRVKYTQLETIFELDDETDANENIDTRRVFGKKNKRTVSCTDGFKPSKTLKEKRKRRIKKFFGIHKKFKRINNQIFMQRLQSNETVEVVDPQAINGA